MGSQNATRCEVVTHSTEGHINNQCIALYKYCAALFTLICLLHLSAVKIAVVIEILYDGGLVVLKKILQCFKRQCLLTGLI